MVYPAKYGEHLVELKHLLNDMVGNTGVEIMTISRPAAYGEYAPYRFAHSEEELIALVKAMRD